MPLQSLLFRPQRDGRFLVHSQCPGVKHNTIEFPRLANGHEFVTNIGLNLLRITFEWTPEATSSARGQPNHIALAQFSRCDFAA